MNDDRPFRGLIEDLRERAKELQCLYRVEEALSEETETLGETLERVVRLIPPGWQYPERCAAVIEIDGHTYRSKAFEPTPWSIHADIEVQGRVLGRISVYYLEESPTEPDLVLEHLGALAEMLT